MLYSINEQAITCHPLPIFPSLCPPFRSVVSRCALSFARLSVCAFGY